MPQDENPDWCHDIVASYDAVAEEYAVDYFGELSRKPFDRELLARFAELLPNGGLVCDMGCGPGHIARYLAELGCNARGVDTSQSMVNVARRLNPHLNFQQGDMLRLPFADGSFAGIAAFYSLIHIERSLVPQALREFFRVLSSGGYILLSFHAGKGKVHVDQYHSYRKPEGPKIALHVTFFGREELEGYLEVTGFQIAESIERKPYEFEYPSRRSVHSCAQARVIQSRLGALCPVTAARQNCCSLPILESHCQLMQSRMGLRRLETE